jgi:hypothetical protein
LIVHRRQRQFVERLPSPLDALQLLAVRLVGRQTPFDARTLLGRKLAVQIGDDLFEALLVGVG